MKWQTIDTAPKDRRILVWINRIGTMTGWWDDERYAKVPKPHWKTHAAFVHGVSETRKNHQPTHWMELPNSPYDNEEAKS